MINRVAPTRGSCIADVNSDEKRPVHRTNVPLFILFFFGARISCPTFFTRGTPPSSYQLLVLCIDEGVVARICKRLSPRYTSIEKHLDNSAEKRVRSLYNTYFIKKSCIFKLKIFIDHYIINKSKVTVSNFAYRRNLSS